MTFSVANDDFNQAPEKSGWESTLGQGPFGEQKCRFLGVLMLF